MTLPWPPDILRKTKIENREIVLPVDAKALKLFYARWALARRSSFSVGRPTARTMCGDCSRHHKSRCDGPCCGLARWVAKLNSSVGARPEDRGREGTRVRRRGERGYGGAFHPGARPGGPAPIPLHRRGDNAADLTDLRSFTRELVATDEASRGPRTGQLAVDYIGRHSQRGAGPDGICRRGCWAAPSVRELADVPRPRSSPHWVYARAVSSSLRACAAVAADTCAFSADAAVD
jgi:hypothetical protein